MWENSNGQITCLKQELEALRITFESLHYVEIPHTNYCKVSQLCHNESPLLFSRYFYAELVLREVSLLGTMLRSSISHSHQAHDLFTTKLFKEHPVCHTS